ncbi:MAG: hypothetical protein IPG66_05915 [Hydrogenophilales bacterium]|nr:hypothetical protein [Hydrogenophilales bacterium]
MARYDRKAAILFKLQSAAGVDAAPSGAANAVLLAGPPKITPLNSSNIKRDLIRPFFGGSEELIGSTYVQVELAVEYVHSGTSDVVAAWDPLLQVCGFSARAILATPNRVEHNLLTDYDTWKLGTMYYHDDGVLHKLLDCKGTFSLKQKIGATPKIMFKIMGLDGGIVTASNPVQTLSAWKLPQAVTDANSGALVLGGAYAAGAITGGTEYVSDGLDFDLGNALEFVDLLGTATEPGQSVDVSDRAGKSKLMLSLTAAQEVSFMAAVKACTTQSIGLVHGTASGYKMLTYLGQAQLINPTKENIKGRRMIGFDVNVNPSSAGNDEVKLVGL